MNPPEKRYKLSVITLALVFIAPFTLRGEEKKAMDEMWGGKKYQIQSSHPGLQWFNDDNYAMFIHWGLYSELAGVWDGKTYFGIGEWIMHTAKIPVDEYKAFAREFNPKHFDALKLVRLAKAAGMKTIVITSKHHDGFALFDSRASDFTVTQATPYKKDLLKQLADACQAEGIRLGFYYSQNQDWTEPYGGNYKGKRPAGYKRSDFDIYFKAKVIPQVTEILTHYGPIALIWFDTPGGMPKTYSEQLVDLVQALQPDCLINSRIGGGFGDYVTLGDMHIPAVRPDIGAWETVDTTNDSWSYTWYDQNWKSPKTICERLVRVIARGGTYMLNVGPKGDGTIPERVVDSLTASGRWVEQHAEAIYGADVSPFDQGFSWGDFTTKGNNLYLHVLDWPESGVIRVSGLGAKAKAASFLHDASRVTTKQRGSILELHLGSQVGRELPLVPVVKLTLNGPASVASQATQIDGLTSVTLLAEMANLEQCEMNEHRWMEMFGEWKHDYYVENWASHDAKARWDMNVLEAGDYMIELEYSCEFEAADSEWVLSCGDESITFVTMESGSDTAKSRRLRNFTTTLGVINLPEGIHHLEITPRNLIGGGMGVKGITIKPYQ